MLGLAALTGCSTDNKDGSLAVSAPGAVASPTAEQPSPVDRAAALDAASQALVERLESYLTIEEFLENTTTPERVAYSRWLTDKYDLPSGNLDVGPESFTGTDRGQLVLDNHGLVEHNLAVVHAVNPLDARKLWIGLLDIHYNDDSGYKISPLFNLTDVRLRDDEIEFAEVSGTPLADAGFVINDSHEGPESGALSIVTFDDAGVQVTVTGQRVTYLWNGETKQAIQIIDYERFE